MQLDGLIAVFAIFEKAGRQTALETLCGMPELLRLKVR